MRAVSVPLFFELGTSFCDWKKLYALRRDQFEDENVCWTWREIGGWFELRKNRNLHVKICMYKNMKAIHITGLKVVGIFGALTPSWRHNGPKRRPCWLTDIPLPKLVLYYKVCGPHQLGIYQLVCFFFFKGYSECCNYKWFCIICAFICHKLPVVHKLGSTKTYL